MTGWFKWNGVKSTEYGVIVSVHPPVTFAAERAEFTDVPSRSGSLTRLEGEDVYADLQLTAECFVLDTGRLNDIGAWLKGEGTVEFANREGGHYRGRIVNQIPFEKVIRGRPNRIFPVNFRLKPFWYPNSEEAQLVTASGGKVVNAGNVLSEPAITVYGGGDIELTVGETKIELTQVSGQVTIDSELMETYSGLTDMNANMSGDYPRLRPGENTIEWAGSVTMVSVKPNARYR